MADRFTDAELTDMIAHNGRGYMWTPSIVTEGRVLDELRERRAEDVELSDYEAVNLLWLLRVAKKLGLDTGDWHHQILAKLSARGHDSVRDANWGEEITEAFVTTLLTKTAMP